MRSVLSLEIRHYRPRLVEVKKEGAISGLRARSHQSGPVPLLLVPLHCAFPGAPPPHPNPSFACSTPPACDLSALVPVLSLSMKLKKFLRDLGITSPPGEHLPYWDPISYTRFLFDFW